MVQVTQTEEEVKIIIELNRLITRKPDIILLPLYIKFNNPPIFFERHLTHEIDEIASFCRIIKTEARIVLVKKQKGIWSEIFEKYTKDELMRKRLEISDQIVERNKLRDQQTLERYEQKRRHEIDKEVKRETAMRERVKQFEENACRDALMIGVRKETHSKERPIEKVPSRVGTPAANAVQRRATAVSAIRSAGTINVNFSNFAFATPKRESQDGKPRPLITQNHSESQEHHTKLETLKE